MAELQLQLELQFPAADFGMAAVLGVFNFCPNALNLIVSTNWIVSVKGGWKGG